ncbi:unnamed protein product [Phytomonas sp. EM1]|nr:unnamed protein product [Phytomonas sp. EM1]|eukprot:CCW61762.1 unnamed protein product [Phytomonas sp. isolate EM1]
MKPWLRAAGPYRLHIKSICGSRCSLSTCWGFRRPHQYEKKECVLDSAKRLLTSGNLLRKQSVNFALPRSHTHEGLAYVACPLCSKELYLHDMLLHLTSVHKGLDADHCERICKERLALYRKIVGTSLKVLNDENKELKAPSLALLPTVTPNGAYLCNWCVLKRDPFPTRDVFIKHVMKEHPELDLDNVEAHIPLPTSGKRPMASSTPRQPPARISNSRASDDVVRPTRYVAGVVPVAEVVESPIVAAPRQVGVSVPRFMNSRLGVGPKEVPVTYEGLKFSENCFPCELCGRMFASELDLLNHLESGHSDGTSPTDVETTANISKYMRTAGSSQPVYVKCDLCNLSKVYTTASALFAHICLKHPVEDAAFHVERIIEAQKDEKPFVCNICYRAFTTQESLDDHTVNKHKRTRTIAVSALDLLGPVTDKTRWWCGACERGFSQAKSLHSHMVTKHQLPTQAHPCPACKRIFSDVYSLDDHFSAQHKGVTLADLGIETHVACPNCGRFFLSHEDLHKHAVRHHKKDPRKPVRAFDAYNGVPLMGNAPRPATQTPAARAATMASADIQSSDIRSDSVDPQKPRKVSRKKL